jgi:hypothetical protein
VQFIPRNDQELINNSRTIESVWGSRSKPVRGDPLIFILTIHSECQFIKCQVSDAEPGEGQVSYRVVTSFYF